MSDTKLKYIFEPLLRKIPAVERPFGHVHFKVKLGWTLGILVLYFALMEVPLFGLQPELRDFFGDFRAIMGGAQGSIIQLGIGPIVMASIILQLLVGAKVIDLNLGDPRDQAIYQGMQKILVLVMIVAESLPLILGGAIRPDLLLASNLGISPNFLLFIIFIQMAIGGILIMLMDEVVSKWGIGSGVGLFILAGVSQSLVVGMFNPINRAGVIWRWGEMAKVGTSAILSREMLLGQGQILALISTIIVFLVVIYAEGMRVEIPLSHHAVRGARGRYPIKLIYASVLPMILVRSLQAVVRVFGTLLWNSKIPLIGHNSWIGAYAENNVPISGLMYYLNPLSGPNDWIPSRVVHEFQILGEIPPQTWQIILHLFTDATVLIVGGIIFAIFWVEVSNMNAEAVANQIHSSGLQIPGFRRSPTMLKKRLENYIPQITVLGGATIGALTLFASLFGLIGGVTGTGMLLAVGIAYKLYEDMASQQMMEMYPMMRRFLGTE